MTRAYGDMRNVFLVFPTVAIGHMGPVWFIEAAWLWLAVGVVITI